MKQFMLEKIKKIIKIKNKINNKIKNKITSTFIFFFKNFQFINYTR